jgi:hypothetical protein
VPPTRRRRCPRGAGDDAGAEHFLGRTTLSALASEPVQTELWDGPDPIPHTRLGQSADLVLVAPPRPVSSPRTPPVCRPTCSPTPCSPHARRWSCARRCTPRCGSTRRWSTTSPRCAGEESTSSSPRPGGSPAATSGAGRLASPERIVAAVERVLAPGDLRDVRMVVSAGGTREPIDAVRVIANRSSGKQGHRARPRRCCPRRVGHAGVDRAPQQPGGRRGRARRDRRRDERGDGAPRSVGRRGRDGRRGRRLPPEGGRPITRSRRSTGLPRSCSSRPPTSSPASVRSSDPIRCWWGSQPRPTTS